VISSYNNFMAQSQVLSASKHYGFGLMGAITSIPAGYESSTIIAHSAGGPNIAMRRWGDLLLARYGKSREVSISDFTTNMLGYSTDNGAFYYYLTEKVGLTI